MAEGKWNGKEWVSESSDYYTKTGSPDKEGNYQKLHATGNDDEANRSNHAHTWHSADGETVDYSWKSSSDGRGGSKEVNSMTGSLIAAISGALFDGIGDNYTTNGPG